MAIVFSKLFVKDINLDVVTIVLICMFICMVIETVRTLDFKQVCAGFNQFLKGMGSAFTGVVGLLVAAGVFAHGIKAIGAIEQMILDG
ncbi:C4-dicarboxylate transporter DcuC [Budvicia aquatica]|uniref:C4-dicarboxylate transporter DcuC n=1 Tax=Budvicia aquatica TaxID=82979 RepID=A0A484ZUP6_9GAMM|nr:C4-dicarboxylate transporter DcuC [Budvicia aquatica]